MTAKETEPDLPVSVRESPAEAWSTAACRRVGALITEIAPEGMKRLSQNRNNAQLWMCLMVIVKSDTVKSYNT